MVGPDVLHCGEEGEREAWETRGGVGAEWDVVSLKQVEQHRAHRERRVPVQWEDALRVEGEVARKPLLADAREDELDRLKGLQVHAGGQGRVEALVQPLRHRHLVRDPGQRRILVERALQRARYLTRSAHSSAFSKRISVASHSSRKYLAVWWSELPANQPLASDWSAADEDDAGGSDIIFQ